MCKKYIKRASCSGLVLVFLYVLLSVLSVAYGASIEDDKGRYILFQLPIVLQSAGIIEFGFVEYLKNFSWGEAYLCLGLPTIFFLYLLGWAIESIGKCLWKVMR